MEQSELHAEVDEALVAIQQDFNLTRQEAASVLLAMIDQHVEGDEGAKC